MKKFLSNILLFLISILIGLLIMEGIVRIAFGDQLALFPRYVSDVQWGDFRIRGNIPNSNYRHKSADGKWDFKINKNGFRNNQDFAYQKPKGVKRILLLGDSFTIGYEVDEDQTYGAVLEAYLKDKGLNVEVLNSGVSGYSTAEALVFFENEGIRYQPDVVVLGFYLNDYKGNIMAGLYDIEDGKIVVKNKEYLPAIKTRNMLNSFALYRWLSGNSYLLCFIRTALSAKIQEQINQENTQQIEDNLEGDKGQDEFKHHVFDLTNGLIIRMRELANKNGAQFIILDMATTAFRNSVHLHPKYKESDLADEIIRTSEFIKAYDGGEHLYRPHGHGHWTDIPHKISGDMLGEMIYGKLTAPANVAVETDSVSIQ